MKPKRQRCWSKALVRHGADARAAIAAVLEVPAEQIGVRDNAGLGTIPRTTPEAEGSCHVASPIARRRPDR
jgi:hypothetical protein